MNRLQLEHIIRAAGSIADDNEVIILGSASVFAQFPDLPGYFLLSIEADVFPKNKPHMSDTIDGSIGELSPFRVFQPTTGIYETRFHCSHPHGALD